MTNRQILTKIKGAKSSLEIQALLAEGEMFDNVSTRTRSRWKKAADKRKQWLKEQAQ